MCDSGMKLKLGYDIIVFQDKPCVLAINYMRRKDID